MAAGIAVRNCFQHVKIREFGRGRRRDIRREVLCIENGLAKVHNGLTISISTCVDFTWCVMCTVLTELENFLVFALCDMLSLQFGTIGCAWAFSSVKIQHETYQNSNWLL